MNGWKRVGSAAGVAVLATIRWTFAGLALFGLLSIARPVVWPEQDVVTEEVTRDCEGLNLDDTYTCLERWIKEFEREIDRDLVEPPRP